jgi:hypothetical protein
MAHRVKDWGKRHASWLAIIFAVLAIVFLVVVCFQAWMLHSRGWRIALGTMPEWVSAAFTGIAAIGVLAAFGNLRIVRREWKIAQLERRDQLANQARLIIVEAVPRAEMVPPANKAPVRPDGKPEHRYVVIRNHSQEPVFNVRIPDGSYVETKKTSPWVTSVAEVVPHDGRGFILLVHGGGPLSTPAGTRTCAWAWPSNISTQPPDGAARRASNRICVLHLHGCAGGGMAAARE